MKITWLGHSGFRIEIENQILLVDPWLDGNPVFPEGREAEALDGATAILLTHGHFDHTGGVQTISKEQGVPIYCIFELSQAGYFEGCEVNGFGKGGTVRLGKVSVTMVNAVHSSSVSTDDGLLVAGSEAGFMIRGEGHTIYVSGDTDVMADMGWMGEYYQPDIGILCCGGHFTMDMKAAAWAAKRFFDFKTVIPCHYKTFEVLAQSADELVAGLEGVDVKVPNVMETVEI